MTDQAPLLEVTDLVKHSPVRGGILRRQVGTSGSLRPPAEASGRGDAAGALDV